MDECGMAASWFFFRCSSSFDCLANDELQNLHVWDFSGFGRFDDVSCKRKWTLMLYLWANFWPHTGHEKGLDPVCNNNKILSYKRHQTSIQDECVQLSYMNPQMAIQMRCWTEHLTAMWTLFLSNVIMSHKMHFEWGPVNEALATAMALIKMQTRLLRSGTIILLLSRTSL